MPDLRLTLLGSFQAFVDGEPVTGFLSNKVRALLAYLAVENDRPHSRDSLVGLLWPESPNQIARASLRTALANLRKVIRDRQTDLPFFERSVQSIRFRPGSNSWVDLHVFQDLISGESLGADSTISQSKFNRLEQAVALCRGIFLEGFYLENCLAFEEWMLIKREQIVRKLSETLQNLMCMYEQKGDYRLALQYSRRQLELEPWDERTHQAVMRFLALSGKRSAALAQYEACRRLLAEELDVEPAPETSQLYRQIRDGELNSAGGAANFPGQLWRGPAVKKELPQPVQLPPILQEESDLQEDQPVFVARQAEMARLKAHLLEMLAGNGRVVFIQGEAGSGKTALMSEFSRQAVGENPDVVTVRGSGCAFTGIGDPYQPFREALQMLSGIVGSEWMPGMISKENARRLWSMIPLTARAILETGPGLIDLLVSRSELTGSLRRAAPFEEDLLAALGEVSTEKAALDVLHYPALFGEITSVLQILSQQHPLILILDDLQWFDRSSAGLLFHLGRHLAGCRVLILGAYRPYEIDRGWGGEEHPLKPVAQELARMSADAIMDLDQADSTGFLEAWIASQPNRLGQRFRDQLYRLTRGHPLFTIELVKDMRERGDLLRDEAGNWIEGEGLDWSRIPEKVEAVIAGRIQRLPEDCQDILSGASMEGEEFTAEVVAHALGLSPDLVIDYLSDLLSKSYRLVEAHRLKHIADRGLSQYRFRHSLFQKYIYQRLDPVKRSILHEAVGKALEFMYTGEDFGTNLVGGSVAIQLARHFEAAGIEHKAAEYLLRSGDYAREIQSYQEAIDYYQRALKLLKSLGKHEDAARTLMKLGLMHHTLFQFNQAHRVYAEGFQLWQYACQPSIEDLLPARQPLRIDWEALPSFDPAYAFDIASAEVNDQLFSGLLALNFEGYLLPEAAASWEVLNEGRCYIFNLRDNLYWSDGVPLKAKDFEFAWKRVMQPETGSYLASLFYCIQGAMEFNQEISSKPEPVGVKAVDNGTLQVDLVGPTSFFPYLMTLPPFKPVPQHVVEQWGPAWTEVDKIQTNGPFRLQAWEPGYAARFERNPYYHGGFPGNLEQVEFYLLPDWRDRLKMYEADELDVLDVTWFPPRDAEQVRLRHASEYISKPYTLTGYIGFDVSRPPFDDVRVRRAFGLAIDKSLLTDIVGRGHLPPATGGFVPPGMPGHVGNIGLAYNPEKACRLLAEAGYPSGRGFPALDFLIPLGAVIVDLEFMRNQWQENLGIRIDIKIVELLTLYQLLKSEPPQLYAMSWSADYPDPDNFLRSSGCLSDTRWQNTVFDVLIKEALKTSDQGERMELYRQAEDILIEETPLLPIVYGRQHLILKPWVKRFPTSTRRSIHWKDVVILRD